MSDSDSELQIEIEIYKRHQKAIEEKKNYYIDPETGLKVFTKEFLKKVRKKCCTNGCRHCPYDDW